MFAADYGYGVKYFVNDWFAVRIDIRHALPFGSVYNNLEATVGMSFLFGGAKPPSAAVVKEPEAAPVTVVKKTEPPLNAL
jgi:OOP family OmpA-OmpF porin